MSSSAEAFLLPQHTAADVPEAPTVEAWLEEKLRRLRTMDWAAPWGTPAKTAPPVVLAEEIASVLVHREFNGQSRSKLAPVLPAVRERLAQTVAAGSPLTLFYLYNGGYRASPLPGGGLVFAPDQTELMLLWQVSRLQQRLRGLVPQGLRFVIVVNNGVASWVNDIPLESTGGYAAQLRRMIHWAGAGDCVSVLLQAELAGFEASPPLAVAAGSAPLPAREHRIVERFLGRACSATEARHRAALYASAEALWSRQLQTLVAEAGALPMRQVPHVDMLSFRPFPGGAIRTQNGSLGFQRVEGALRPKLLTTETLAGAEVCCLPWSPPWEVAGHA